MPGLHRPQVCLIAAGPWETAWARHWGAQAQAGAPAHVVTSLPSTPWRHGTPAPAQRSQQEGAALQSPCGPGHHASSWPGGHFGAMTEGHGRAQPSGWRDKHMKTIPPAEGQPGARGPRQSRERGRPAAARKGPPGRRLPRPCPHIPRPPSPPAHPRGSHLESGKADGFQHVEAEDDTQRVLKDPGPPGTQSSPALHTARSLTPPHCRAPGSRTWRGF